MNEFQNKEHTFAQYIRIIGKGKNGARHLDQDEAYQAMTLLLNGQVLDEQVGAFMMLMRMKEESAAELTGFALAVKQQIPSCNLQPDIDWPCYAGKKRQLPWFLLAALALANSGKKVFMHGYDFHTIGRTYAQNSLKQLGIQSANSLKQAQQQLTDTNFSYLCLSHLSPFLAEIMGKRNIFGLRTPVHTLARVLNPLNANTVLQGIFHPAYQGVHQQTNCNLGYQQALVYKGEGGEFERNPEAERIAFHVQQQQESEIKIEKLLARRLVKPKTLDIEELRHVWHGNEHAYGLPAVIGSIELALLAANPELKNSYEQAEIIWHNRDLERIKAI